LAKGLAIAGQTDEAMGVIDEAIAYVRIPRDGEQCFHGIVNMDSTAT